MDCVKEIFLNTALKNFGRDINIPTKTIVLDIRKIGILEIGTEFRFFNNLYLFLSFYFNYIILNINF